MKNKFLYLIINFLIIFFIFPNVVAIEQFNFDITEIEIKENGNKFIGKKRGLIKSNDGLEIEANEFEYDKLKNILYASGNIKILDKKNKITLYSNNIIYSKNYEIIVSKGKTKSFIDNEYTFFSEDIEFNRNSMEVSSLKDSKIVDSKSKIYEFNKYKFYINDKLLKASDVYIRDNIDDSIENSDHLYFSSGFFDLNSNNFTAGKTEIKLKKNTFNNPENDPRISGISSNKNDEITVINKGVFSSCKINDNCPPWSIKAEKIQHNKIKKQLIYNNALLKIYDVPVLYFPKFFHPDPSVKRQSGFLQPRLNDSPIGSSVSAPYFHVISENKDFTFEPTIFDNNVKMFQNEYRQENKFSSFISDFGLTTQFKSLNSGDKNSISHLFSRFNLNLNLEKFNSSNFNLYFEKVTNDTYLKVFDSLLVDRKLKPTNSNLLKSGINLYLENNDYNLNLDLISYEDLQKNNSDRYEYVFPSYQFNTNILKNTLGVLEFTSLGSNNLINTNSLKTKVINDINFFSNDILNNNYGLKNNYEIYLKNLNSVGKKDSEYQSNLKSELSSQFILNSSLPLSKVNQENSYKEILVPKISFRLNPNDMINYDALDRTIDASNIFTANRLGLDDTLEVGNSLTLGLNYSKLNTQTNIKDINIDLGTVFRDNVENNIPSKTSINKKNSNLFGSLDYNFSENFTLEYDFSIDNKIEAFDYNSIELDWSINNFSTELNFIETSNALGNTNVLENNFTYNFDEKNFLSFKTRRNRTINLTEYYDLVYEYKNDCLTAGIKYKKSYYNDRDLKPSENLMFTITIYPLTTYEQKLN